MSTSITKKGIEYLERLPLWSGSLDFSLHNPAALMEALGNPQDQIKSIHIAGTNGKGSTAAFSASILRSLGYSVVQLASPHLVDVTERCIVNGKPIKESVLSEAIDSVVSVAVKKYIKLTYFELITAASFLICKNLKVDWVVVEVGLGGRLDATNVIQHPTACAITSISMDHMHALGNSLTEIAEEKAGIIKLKTPVYVGRVTKEVRQVIYSIAYHKNAPMFFLGEDFEYDDTKKSLNFGSNNTEIDLHSSHLQGSHQLDNASIAACITLRHCISDNQVRKSKIIEKGIHNARWPGRLDFLEHNSRMFLLDAAHNPSGMETLLNYLSSYLPERKSNINKKFQKLEHIIFVFSFLETKDWRTMLIQIQQFMFNLGTDYTSIEIRFTKSHHRQAVSPQILRETAIGIFGNTQIKIQFSSHETASEAIQMETHLVMDKSITIVAGSLYLLGEMYKFLGKGDFSTIANSSDD